MPRRGYIVRRIPFPANRADMFGVALFRAGGSDDLRFINVPFAIMLPLRGERDVPRNGHALGKAIPAEEGIPLFLRHGRTDRAAVCQRIGIEHLPVGIRKENGVMAQSRLHHRLRGNVLRRRGGHGVGFSVAVQVPADHDIVIPLIRGKFIIRLADDLRSQIVAAVQNVPLHVAEGRVDPLPAVIDDVAVVPIRIVLVPHDVERGCLCIDRNARDGLENVAASDLYAVFQDDRFQCERDIGSIPPEIPINAVRVGQFGEDQRFKVGERRQNILMVAAERYGHQLIASIKGIISDRTEIFLGDKFFCLRRQDDQMVANIQTAVFPIGSVVVICRTVKCIATDARYTVGKDNARQTAASIECININARYAVGNDNARQTATTGECIAPDICYTVRNINARQTAASRECTATDTRYTFRNLNVCQATAILECMIPNACQLTVFSECYARQVTAIRKCIIFDVRYTVGNDDARQTVASIECICPDACYSIRNDKLSRQFFPVNIKRPIPSKTISHCDSNPTDKIPLIINTRQIVAFGECPIPDTRYSVRNDNAR